MTAPETSRRVEASKVTHRAFEVRLTRATVFLLLAVAVVILGLNWPILVLGLESVTPIWMAAFRVGGAAIVFGLFLALSGNLTLPPRRDVPMILTIGVFRLATLMGLVFTALQLVPAGRASVLVWTASLWTVPAAAIFLGERMTARRWVGLALGLLGVLILSEAWGNNWREIDVIVGTGLLLLGAMINAVTAVYMRGHHWTIGAMQAVPWQMGAAAAPLIVAGLIVEGPPTFDWTTELVLIMLYQTVLASGLAFWAQTVVLRNLSAVSTNLTMMGVPVLGVASSAIVLNEPITAALALGMVLVMAGVTINLLADASNLLADASNLLADAGSHSVEDAN